MLKRVSLILSVVGLVSLPSIVFKSSLLALPAITRMDSFPENFFLIYYSMYFIYIQAVFLNKLTFIVIYPHSGDLVKQVGRRPDSPLRQPAIRGRKTQKNLTTPAPVRFGRVLHFQYITQKYRAMAAFYLPQPCIFAEKFKISRNYKSVDLFTCHLSFLSFDHLFNHISAYRTILCRC